MTADPAGEIREVRSFYEGYVEEHVPYHRSPSGLKKLILSWLPYASYREWRFWRRWVPRGCRLLDLGCARGREIFRERSKTVVGIDLAANALADCSRSYNSAVLGSLANLPFSDAAFDCVVSSHVLGHVPASAKSKVLAEAARVLRPGGRSLHLIETDSTHPLIAIARRHPQLYHKWLIEQDGHVGLERAGDIIERFRASGCRLESVETIDAGPLHPRLTEKWFDNDLAALERRLADEVARARRTLDSPLRLTLEEIRLGVRHYWLAPRRDPIEQAPFLATVFIKPS